MELVTGMLMFVRAAEARSFTQAAKILGVTSSGIGKAVARLEADLGVRLLHRTTRRVALTDDGAVFLEHCRRVLEEVEAAKASLADRSQSPRGRLRVSVPHFVGRDIVVPALATFIAAHPDVSLDIELSDRKVNLVEERFDLAVRVGELRDSSFVARRLGSMEMVTVASPSLLAKGAIESLGDLAVAPIVAFRQPTTGRERPWSFAIGGRRIEWSPRARLVLDSGDAMVQAAIAGLGATQVPAPMASAALASGALVEILAHQRARPLPIHAICPATAASPRTRAFLDFLASIPSFRPAGASSRLRREGRRAPAAV